MNAVVQSPPVLTPIERPTEAQALMQIIERAASAPDFDVDKLAKLLDVKERWDAEQARREFIGAMAAFKADPPRITKNRHVKFQTARGVTEYDHASHDEVTEKIGQALSRHGLSHRWDVEQADARITVTCIVTHVAGHSERVTLSSAPDDSGGKNSIQAISSAVTYLQRYTLLAATGLSTADIQDDDGRAADHAPQQVEAPEGYAKWRGDMTAVADEGSARLKTSWRKAQVEFRTHAVDNDAQWWADCKARAEHADTQE